MRKPMIFAASLGMLLLLGIATAGCGNGTATPTPTVLPVTVAITAGPSHLGASETYQFIATVTNTTDTTVTWNVSGCASACGSITAGGLYAAPPFVASEATATITATSRADPTKSASINLVLKPVSVSLAPNTPGNVLPGGTRSFTATLDHDPNNAGVAWALSAQPDPQASRNGDTTVVARSWAPPEIDAAVPPTRNDVPCILDEVLSNASGRVRQLVVSLQEFGAVERVEHAELDKQGKARRSDTATFNYVAQINKVPFGLAVEEYRDGRLGEHGFPSRLASRGLAAFALIFHPEYIRDFAMTCEGMAEMQGRPAWQVRFAQQRQNNFRGYDVNKLWHPVMLKGRAWIDAGTFQVMRLESDLMEPLKNISLEREHIEISYRPVEFRKRRVELWLPEGADIYMDFQRHKYHQRHSFSEFQLFSVDVGQKVEEPKETPSPQADGQAPR